MTPIFIFPHFGLNIHHSFFLYFVNLKGFVFIIGKFVWLHYSDKIVKPTCQNSDKIVKSWYDIFAISPTPNSSYTFFFVSMFPGNWTHNLLHCWRSALPLSHRNIRHLTFVYFVGDCPCNSPWMKASTEWPIICKLKVDKDVLFLMRFVLLLASTPGGEILHNPQDVSP